MLSAATTFTWISAWGPAIGDKFNAEMEVSNQHDRYAVTVKVNQDIVGHVLREISKVLFYFIKNGGTVDGAKVLISAHNPNFQASRDWLQRFFIRNSLSLRARTSTEQIITASCVKTSSSTLTWPTHLQLRVNDPRCRN